MSTVALPIVDARTGRVVRPGEQVRAGDDPADWYVIEMVGSKSWRSVLLAMVFGDGRTATVEAPIKYFPKLTYGRDFPVGGFRIIMVPS